MQGDFVEEGREEFIDGFANDERIHAYAGKDIPGTHGPIVLVHLEAIAARLIDKGASDEGSGVGVISTIAMGDAFCGESADNSTCQFGQTESAEEERNMDVGLISLVIKLFAEESLQLCAKFFLADKLYHSRQIHGRSPSILPSCSLIKAVAFHLCIGLVDMLELFWPDAVEYFLASASPFVGIFLHTQFACQLSQSPKVAACLEALVGTLKAEPLHLCHHTGISVKKRRDADALTISIEKGGYGVLCSNCRHAFVVRAPVLLACYVQLGERLHDVRRMHLVEQRNEGELRAIGVPKRPRAVVVEALRLVRLAVRAEVVGHGRVGDEERAVKCSVERGVEDSLLVFRSAFHLNC